MKTKLTVLGILLLCCAKLASASDDDGLTLTVTYTVSEAAGTASRDPDVEGDGHIRYDFFAIFCNESNTELVMPRARPPIIFSTSTTNGQDKFAVLLMWDIPNLAPGVPDIPSESELGLVRLLPGESTKIRIAFQTDTELPEGNITFVYVVTKAIAARFKTWGGELKVPALSQHEARIQQAQKNKEKK